jgi:serine-type D-Ala-D-Ala carboxypeptidase/endopeptidase
VRTHTGSVWAELLIALVVEGYREFMEWWQNKLWRRAATAVGQEPQERATAAEQHVAWSTRDRSSEVERLVAATLNRHARRHVGLAVGVWWQGESWTFARGRIFAGRSERPTAGTIFEVGSITKVFTATVLADMVEEGLAAPDDPVQRYLPDGVELPVHGRPITLADLATQTSGLPRLPKGLIWRSLRQRDNPYAGFTDAELERAVTRASPRRAPGEKLRYSNLGYGLLGHALALRTGQSYEQLVRSRICDPLGLADTRISIPTEATPRSRTATTGEGVRSRTGTFRRWPARARSGRRLPTSSASSSSSFVHRLRGWGARPSRRTRRAHGAAGSPRGSGGSASRYEAARARCSGTTAVQAAFAASSAS